MKKVFKPFKYCDSANSSGIQLGNCKLYFSYDTCIAFEIQGNLTIRKNDWNTTTGKHLNAISNNKALRIDGKKFEMILDALIKQSINC